MGERSVAVVTGAASGIGRSLVNALLEADPAVLVVAVDAQFSAGAPQDGDQGRVWSVGIDVTDEAAVTQLFSDIGEQTTGPLRSLVCAAGVQERIPSVDLTLSDFHRVLATHVDGSLLFCREAARRMPRGGSIVLFSSVAEFFGWPERVAYAVAKAGISAMARSLAVEWSPLGIRVNSIAPGYVDTPMIHAARARGELPVELAELHAMGRLAQPEELAKPVIFLLSDGASFITGETVIVDGGYSVYKSR